MASAPKQISEFPDAGALSATDYILLQQGATGTALSKTMLGPILDTPHTTMTVSGAGSVSGNLTVGNAKFVVTAASGNTAVAGTLGVTGATTLAGLTATTIAGTTGDFSGNLAVATNKFTVAAASGNTTVGGTLGVTGATTLNALTATTIAGTTGAFSGDFAVATNKATINATTGDTVLAGSVTGASFIPTSATAPTNGMYLPAANTLGFSINSAAEMSLTASALSPATSNGLALGTTTLMWSDAFFASGSVLNFDNGDVTVTHSSDTLTVAGGGLSLTGAGTGLAVTNNATIGGTVVTTGSETAAAFIPASATIPTNGMYLPAGNTLGWAISSAAEVQLTSTALSPAVSDGSALGTSSLMWGDLFLASGGVINFNASNVTITHSAAALGISGATVTVTRNSTDASGTIVALSVAGAQSVANAGAYNGIDASPSYTAASGTLGTLLGVRGLPVNSGAGTVSDLRGVAAQPQNTSTGTVTNSMGVFVRNDNTNAGGTVTNAFGLYIAAPYNAGTMTNKWGVYQLDTASQNFLGGRTLIGAVTDDGSTAFQVNGNAKATGYFLRSVGNALTATGTTRADALQLAKEVNRITTAAAGTGVILPVGVVGMRIRIYQSGANPVKVYASASETIDGTAGSTGVTLTNALRCEYEFVAANTWISAQLGVVSA